MHPASSCSQQWVMWHHIIGCCRPRRLGGHGVERLVGCSSHVPHGYPTAWASCHLPVIPPLFVVICGPVICWWGSSHSLLSIVVSHHCHLSVGFPVIHCHLSLSPVPVMSCHLLLVVRWFIYNYGWWQWYCDGCGCVGVGSNRVEVVRG